MTQTLSMISFLNGWLAGSLMSDNAKVMKITEVIPLPPHRLTVTFASGLKLYVTVESICRELPKE